MHDNNLNLIQKTMASAEYIANVMAGLEQVGAAIKAREQASSDRTSSRGLQAAIQTGAVSPVRPSPSKKRKKKMSKAARAKAKAELKAKKKANGLAKKRSYEYG